MTRKLIANAEGSVTARQQCLYEGPSTANRCKEHYVEKCIQWVTTLSLTIRVYLHSFSPCLPNLRNPANFSENSNFVITCQGHPRSSVLVSIESAFFGL